MELDNDSREMLDELTDALHNMLAFFDTPVARTKMRGEFEDEARRIARDAFHKAKAAGYGMQLQG